MTRIALITNCTASQSVQPHPSLCGANLPRVSTTLEAATEWAERLKGIMPTIPPAKLYQGISFATVTKATHYVAPEDIYVVSIGQGFVGFRENIVPYDLSINPDHQHSLTRVITGETPRMDLWWECINESQGRSKTPIQKMASQVNYDLIIVAVTSNFRNMIRNDLLQAALQGAPIVLIVTNAMGLSANLVPYSLHYDARIRKISIGNRNDLSQRAALHLLEQLSKCEELPKEITEIQELVNNDLSRFGSPTSRKNALKELDNLAERIRVLLGAEKPKDTPDTLYSIFRTRLNCSLLQFRAAFRRAYAVKPAISAQKLSNSSKSAAFAAFQSISSAIKPVGTSGSWQQESESLETLQVFVDTIRENQPDAVFTSKDVFAWVEMYYKELDLPIPPQISTPMAISTLFRTYRDNLGVTSRNTSKIGRSDYMLIPELEDVEEDKDAG